ncbi:putative PEP-binding protein [Acaryochloris sp. IP29b_bin.148]|uniref:putative PEP-binding protein n=1 Tax=Acaryochloris sp. IP29b_bin.148 TaxID=2969218 RepID=UPI00261F8408|nr:putative PEP-binding protein [Acaryochloris sp. IP29b_bin.148]
MRSATQDFSVESLYWFDQFQNAHPSVVGQAAQELSDLAQSDVPVLSGLVLSATALQDFCHSVPWSSPFLSDFPHLSLRLQQEQPFQLQAVADEICQGLKTTSFPPQWLQRILADLQPLPGNGIRLTPSLALPQRWAEHISHILRMLPVHYCQRTPVSVEQAIKQVWSCLYTAQTLFLLQDLAIPIEQVKLGIIFQPVELVQAAGFLTLTPTHFHIQATSGLSQGILAGEVLPDLYSFDRQTETWQQDRGNITCSYQATPLNPALAKADTVVSTTLDPARKQAFVLNTKGLQQLLTLAQKLSSSSLSLPVVEWVIAPRDPENLKIVSVWTEPPLPLPPLRSTPDGPRVSADGPPAIVQGLAAAIGQVKAPLVVLEDRHPVPPQDVIGQIVVVDRVVPTDVVWLQQVAGLICTTGGYTSHGAIMARELGLPAVVGATSALEIFQSGQVVVLDGAQGQVYDASQLRLRTQDTATPKDQYPVESPPLNTQVWVNLSQPKLLKRALQLPVQGVGLLRSEWFLLDICQGQLPSVWIQQQGATQFVAHLSQHLQSFVQAWSPRPVFYRSLDLKNNALIGVSTDLSLETEHSMLGLRGASHYVYDSALFDLELRALAHLYGQGCSNLRLILPFVRSVEEFIFCRDRIQATGLDIQIWMMAEVPAVLFQLPEYVEAGVQGIAIGTSDLTQLLLGVDRDHPYLTQQYSEDHPAVVAAMSQLVQTAQRLGIPCSICGQAPVHHPQLVETFVEWGVTAISVDMVAVAETQRAIANAEQRLQVEGESVLHPSATQNG